MTEHKITEREESLLNMIEALHEEHIRHGEIIAKMISLFSGHMAVIEEIGKVKFEYSREVLKEAQESLDRNLPYQIFKTIVAASQKPKTWSPE